MKNLENNQANIGTCMKNMKRTCLNQANLGASLKNLETQIGQLAQSVREHPPKSFPSNTKINPKQCMAVTLRSGKKLDEPKNAEKDETQVQQKNMEAEKEKEETEIEENMEAKIEVNNKAEKQKFYEVVLGRMTFPDNPLIYTSP